MAGEINAMISDRGEVPGGVMATGSVVSGDWLEAYQTATDDMFVAAQGPAYTTGSVAVIRSPATGATATNCVGIAGQNAGSGEFTSILTEGLFIGVSAGTVTAGKKVMQEGNSGIIDYNDDASGVSQTVGRAFTGASAGDKYVLFKLNV